MYRFIVESMGERRDLVTGRGVSGEHRRTEAFGEIESFLTVPAVPFNWTQFSKWTFASEF